MYISKFRIFDYKSFLDSGEVDLLPGINIITGQNNAGKTASMQAISLNFDNKPHKSLKTFPLRNGTLSGPSKVEIQFDISKDDIENFILSQHQVVLPTIEGGAANFFIGRALFDRLPERTKLTAKFQNRTADFAIIKLMGTSSLSTISYDIYVVNKVKKQLQDPRNVNVNGQQNVFILLANSLKSRIYSFKAERLNVGSCPFGPNSILNSDASNLPEVLNILQSNKSRFERYSSYVKKVFPNIHAIAVNARANSIVEIVLWNEDPTSEREDLVVPLSECGTGIGQVLAILYVVLTSNTPTVILIDEPNSFLHPGASKKLIEILKEHPQHQFIISTHSPEIISASNPKTIHVIKTIRVESNIIPINIKEANEQRIYLTEIGAKLSDVFGADNILWVEGKTEELCFPKIIEKMEGLSLMGTSILAVKNTGDLEGKHAKTIYDIYSRLSNGQGLMPSAIGFIFDREGKTEQEISDLKKQSRDVVAFTNRKMFENYIIHPTAIYNVLKSEMNGISEATIINWIETNKWLFIDQRYSTEKRQEDWLLNVNGAKFLEKLFNELTEAKLQFNKVKHSVALADWIIENSFDDLKEYTEILSGFLQEKVNDNHHIIKKTQSIPISG